MYYPMVGERVRMGDCPYRFVVVQVDYSERLVTLAPVPAEAAAVLADPGLADPGLQENVPLDFLHSDRRSDSFSAIDRERLDSALYSSQQRVDAGRAILADMRESIAVTMNAIRQSASLLERSDAMIERTWRLERTPRSASQA